MKRDAINVAEARVFGEATGIPAPVMVDGIAQKPIEGVSMVYTFDMSDADAPSTHKTQYFEMMGVRVFIMMAGC